MRVATSSLDLRRARTLDEALAILRDDGERVPLAGGTDVYVALNFGTATARRFLDIWAIDELRRVELRGDTLVLGALATYTMLIRSPDVRARLPMLVDAARQVGGPQIQNRGTIGGNLANASPAGDTLPVLAAADAVVVLRGAAGERRVPIMDFFTGYRATVLEPDQMIVAVEVPRVEGTQSFRKVGTRAAQAISKVVVACVRGDAPRIALGSVGPMVVRAIDAERALADGASADEAAALVARSITPIDDVRSTAAYRREVTANLVRRAFA